MEEKTPFPVLWLVGPAFPSTSRVLLGFRILVLAQKPLIARRQPRFIARHLLLVHS